MKHHDGYCTRGARPFAKFVLTAVGMAAIASTTLSAQAALDVWGDPPATDESHYTDQPADPTVTLENLLTAIPANEGSMELPNGGVLLETRSNLRLLTSVSTSIQKVYKQDEMM